MLLDFRGFWCKRCLAQKLFGVKGVWCRKGVVSVIENVSGVKGVCVQGVWCKKFWRKRCLV